jgi:hypothetical protein
MNRYIFLLSSGFKELRVAGPRSALLRASPCGQQGRVVILRLCGTAKEVAEKLVCFW